MARPNQREHILAYVKDVYARHGYSPSIGEITAYLELNAKSNVHRQLQQLVQDGQLKNLGGRYVPVGYETSASLLVPLLGKVAAGQPITAVQDLEGYVAYLPQFGDGRELFALRVQGESMIEIGIRSGDVVIVEETPEAKNGDIVVALIEDEATVKTFFKEAGHIRLQPENHTMKPIIVQDATILGRVVSSMRYY